MRNRDRYIKARLTAQERDFLLALLDDHKPIRVSTGRWHRELTDYERDYGLMRYDFAATALRDAPLTVRGRWRRWWQR